MKNGLLVWNVVLTLIAGYLLFKQFDSGKKAGGSHKTESRDTTGGGGNHHFRIAYFEMDSIEAHFDMVKDIKSEVTIKEEAMNQELEKLGRDYQNKIVFYQNKQKEMTQQEYESAALDLKKMEQTIGSRKVALEQEYTEFSMKKTKAIKSRIEDFIREYNKTRNYSYIIAEEPGFFYFKDSTQNITSDVLRGLNEQYKTSKNK